MDYDALPEWQKAQRGELYHAFIPELIAWRDKCTAACNAFNENRDQTRRTTVKLWRNITRDNRPLPPQASTTVEDDALFEDEPWVIAPIHADYGSNIRLGKGARTLVGPNCSFYSGTHPLDPAIRMGTTGPELGKPISIGEDCWLGGNIIILPGVTIGKGSTIGAGSVVAKDVPAFHVAAGNPARILRRIETKMDPEQNAADVPADEEMKEGAEVSMAKDAATGPA